MGIVKENQILELQRLSKEVNSLRTPGTKTLLPEDLKLRILRLWKSGVTFAEIRRATGVQPGSLRNWQAKTKIEPISRPLSILSVVECKDASIEKEERSLSTVKFQYAQGKVTVEVPIAALSPDLLARLTAC